MHKITGARDPAAAFPLRVTRDDAQERRAANRAVAVSAAGLTVTGALSSAIVLGFPGFWERQKRLPNPRELKVCSAQW